MKRSRIAAAAVAVALVGASTLVITMPATAVANVPTLYNLGGTSTNVAPTIQGEYDNSTGDEVEIRVEVSDGGPFAPYCTDTILAAENSPAEGWACAGAPLVYGDYTFRSYAFDSLNALQSGYSATTSYQIGGQQAGLITSPAPGANTADATVTYTGSGPSRGTAIVFDNILGTLCSSPIDVAGNWSCTTIPLDQGVHVTYAITETIDFDVAFQTVTPDQNLTIDPPPAPTVDPYPFVATGPGSPEVQGNSALDIGQILVFSSPDNVTWSLYCTVPQNPLATVWFCPSPSGSLPLGTNYIAATANSEFTTGASSPLSPSITIQVEPPPVLVSPADGTYTNDNTPTFAGTAAYGANVQARLVAPAVAVCGSAVVAGAWSCTSGPIVDGTYQWFVNASPGNGIASGEFTFTIDTVAPDAPVITQPGMTTTSQRPVLRGTSEPGARVEVWRDGALAGCVEGTVYANGSGQWQCTSSASLTVGRTYGFGVAQNDLAGNRSTAGAPPVTLSLTILAPASTPSAPPAPPALLAWNFSFGVGGTEFAPGDSTELNAAGLPVGAAVEVEFHSTPVVLGETLVKPDGSFAMQVTIPEDAEIGPHKFVVTVTPLEGPPSVQEQAVTVRIPPKQAGEPVHEKPFVAPPGAVGSDRNDPAAPSSFTRSIETAWSIFTNPLVIGSAAVAGFVLILLVAFPAELLNTTISEEYHRFAGLLPAVRAPWWQRFMTWMRARPLLGSILLIVTASIIFGFADPGFGFDITSLRVVLACALALFVLGYLASVIAGAIIRRRWGLATRMELKPLGLILTVIGVVLTRLLDFSPGFLLGLLLGVAVVGSTTVAQRAKITLVNAGVVFAFAIVAWIVYSVLSITIAPNSFGMALAFDTLVVVTVEGLTALFIGLLPVRFLDGQTLFEFSKPLWAGVYAFAALAFVLIVLPASWGRLDGSLGIWLVILIGFAVVAVGLYLYFRFWAPPHKSDDDEDDEGARQLASRVS